MRIICLVLLAVLAASNAQPVTRVLDFNLISTPWNSPISLAYHEPSNSVLSSANFGTGGTLNLGLVDETGTFQAYSPLANDPGEVNIAVVQPGHPVLTSGDVYGGWNFENGAVFKVSNGILTEKWCKFNAQNNFAFGGFAIDTTGKWGWGVVAITAQPIGEIWVMDPTCSAPYKVAQVNDWCEGIIVVPDNATIWGPLAGRILVGCEVTTKLYSVDPITHQTTDHGATGVATDDLDVIPDKQNWFGMNWDNGRYIGASWDQFTGLAGYILSTTHGSGLQVLWWNFATNSPSFTLLQVAPTSPFQPSTLWEQSSFTPSGIGEIIDASYSLCVKPYIGSTLQSFTPTPIKVPSGTAVGNYKYSINTANSAGSGMTPAPQDDTLLMFFTQDSQNTFTLTIVVDSISSATGGSLQMTMQSSYLGTPTLVLQDDRSDPNSISAGDTADTLVWTAGSGGGNFQWTWGPGRTDGLVLSPLKFVNPPGPFTITFNILSQTGLTAWKWANREGNNIAYYSLDLAQTFTLERFSCTCGNGKKDQVEQCDGEICCLECKFRTGYKCRLSTGPCDPPEYCDGTSAYCPADDNTTCYGPCASLGTCDLCAQNPACGWCCETASCIPGNATNPPSVPCKTFQGGVCSCSGTCQNGGQCTCGACACAPGYTGPNCQFILGCDNKTYTDPNDPNIPKPDVCNVCNGTGTTCLGCDGLPFGATYDVCGVCAGNGSTCYTLCSKNTDCGSCTKTEGCSWCPSSSICEQTGYIFTKDCADNKWITDCNNGGFFENLTPAQVGLGAGALAAIIIGSVVGAILLIGGGKKGYDLLVNSRMADNEIKTSPLYKDPGTSGTSPLYMNPKKDIEMK